MKCYEYLTDYYYKDLILNLIYALPEENRNNIERITITKRNSSYKITVTTTDKLQEQWIYNADKQIFARMFTRKKLKKEG